MSKKLTKEEFIEKARKKHGDKYNYDKVDYIGNKTKVTIVCPIHGEFEQRPHDHLLGQGCPKCKADSRRLTAEEFIQKAKEIHGDKYDYSKVNYIDNKTKVTIVCPEHGEFEQRPRNHLFGQGCPRCADKTLSTEEFIERARKIHGDKYDYSKVNYINANTKVTIICPIHGEFEQMPHPHLKGSGCSECSGVAKSTKEEFIERARKIHGDKYDYSKVNYINNKTKVTIVCSEHGEFEQTPINHLRGDGCPWCAGNAKSTTEEFIEKARKIHGDKYDYSKVNYIDKRTNVTIICPEHGEFEQRPDNHLRGSGCPNCISYKLEREIEEFLTNNSIEFESQKTFDWLKNINKLSLDFYLPIYNIAIECQGIQHFRPIDLWGGEEKFKYTVENDSIKRDLCTEHGIRMIYYSDLGIDYPYEVIEDLDEILKIIKNI